jgi:hypothetical protein
MGDALMRWILSIAIAALISVLGLLQAEFNQLRAQLATAALAEQKAAPAIKQFEADLLSKLRADEKARQGALAGLRRNATLPSRRV